MATTTSPTTKKSAAKKAPAKKAAAKDAGGVALSQTAPKKRGPRTMSASHKDALAKGRVESSAVKGYLEVATTSKQRGRRPSPERMIAKLASIDEQLDGNVDAIKRLNLLQDRKDTATALESISTPPVPTEDLEKGFVKYAKAYGTRKGISYATWREIGVDASVLKAAGITRGA